MIECNGISIEPYDQYEFSGCGGGEDCPVCAGTGYMRNCPDCLGSLDGDDTCVSCELIWAEVG